MRFSLADVFLPYETGGTGALHDETEVEGVITSFSDSGSKMRAFAIVDVIRKQSLVVPVDKLKAATGSTKGP